MKQLLKQLCVLLSQAIPAGMLLSFVVYSITRVLFFKFPFSFSEEVSALTYLTIQGCILGSIGGLVVFAVKKYITRFHTPVTARNLVKPILIVSLIFLASCQAVLPYQVTKDIANGVTTTSEGLTVEKVLKVMNGEVVEHNEVVLGESFVVMNNNVGGLKERDGKVSVGCSLVITDEQGKELLNEPDLFKQNDVFDAATTKQLKCTISTGNPMKWEHRYHAVVTFWDKYGRGKIENCLDILIQDIP
ncbi:MAG: hypothetical protein QM731_20165 [Chitinophagaceae bacterium]